MSINYKINLNSNNGVVQYRDGVISLVARSDHDNTWFSLSVDFPEWEDDTYVLLPACAYDGNRFERVRYEYPPMYRECDCKNAAPVKEFTT